MRAVYASLPALALAFRLAPVSTAVPAQADSPPLSDILARAGRAAAAFTDPPRQIVCEESGRESFIALARSPTGDTGHYEDRLAWYREVVAVLSVAPGRREDVPWHEDERVLSPWHESRKVVSAGALKPGGPTRPLYSLLPEYVIGTPSALPRFAAVFLLPANQPRFRFSGPDRSRVNNIDAMKVDYREKSPSVDGVSRRGSFWIELSSAQVVKSVLTQSVGPLISEVTVTYALDSQTGLYVPAELRERSALSEFMRADTKANVSKCRAVPLKRP